MQSVRRHLLALAPRVGAEEGQTFVEYALVLVLVAVAVAVLAAWTNFDNAIGTALSSVIGYL
jgi:Flp pilus assembly pilin Flp